MPLSPRRERAARNQTTTPDSEGVYIVDDPLAAITVPVSISYLELEQNNTVESLTALVDSRVRNAKFTIVNELQRRGHDVDALEV